MVSDGISAPEVSVMHIQTAKKRVRWNNCTVVLHHLDYELFATGLRITPQGTQ